MSIEGIKGAGMTYQGSVSATVSRPETAEKNQGIENQRTAAELAIKTTDMNIRKASADNNNGKNEQEARQGASQGAMTQAVNEINKNNPDSVVQFGFHEETKRMTIKILDKESKKVIREFPAEESLDLIAKAWEMAGILVDEKR